MSHLGVFKDFLEFFFMFFQYKMRYIVVITKKNPLLVCGCDKQICPTGSLASFVMPIIAPQDRFFYPTLTLLRILIIFQIVWIMGITRKLSRKLTKSLRNRRIFNVPR